MRNMFAGQRDRIAGLGIAPDACCSEVERETPETTDLDALTMTERLAHHLQQRLHCQVNIICPRRLNIEPLCRLNSEPGRDAVVCSSVCG